MFVKQSARSTQASQQKTNLRTQYLQWDDSLCPYQELGLYAEIEGERLFRHQEGKQEGALQRTEEIVLSQGNIIFKYSGVFQQILPPKQTKIEEGRFEPARGDQWGCNYWNLKQIRL